MVKFLVNLMFWFGLLAAIYGSYINNIDVKILGIFWMVSWCIVNIEDIKDKK